MSEPKIQPHPVAKLLNDEQRARVRAATFVPLHSRSHEARVAAKIGGRWHCLLGVAIGGTCCPQPRALAETFGLDLDDDRVTVIQQFTELVDAGQVRPEDVKALLACEDDDE